MLDRLSLTAIIIALMAMITPKSLIYAQTSTENPPTPIKNWFGFSAKTGYDVNFSPQPNAVKLVGIETWLNTPPVDVTNNNAKLTLVNFWTYSCFNTVNTLPSVTRWQKLYGQKGLTIVGVHSPEFESDKDLTRIKKSIAKHGITYAVAVDNELKTWRAYHNNCWPAFYFINNKGKVVKAICGEHDYDKTENFIKSMLK